MNRPVLIVGGGPSGLSAAHALAAAGQRVVLVDKAEQLGGAPILSGYAKLVPTRRVGQGRHRRHGQADREQ